MRVLITGANRGIGAGLMEAYRAAGHEVSGTTRGEGRDGLLPLDVTEPGSLEALAGSVAPPLDLLVCNAGIYADKGQTLDQGYPEAMWSETFAVNVTGVFRTIQAFLPHLRAAPAGRIAIISSQMGSDTRAPGGSYIYRASKAAALNLGRNLASDLKPEGIAVGIYHPGWVRTDMGGGGADLSVGDAAAGLVRRFEELTPATTGCFRTWDGRDHPF